MTILANKSSVSSADLLTTKVDSPLQWAVHVVRRPAAAISAGFLLMLILVALLGPWIEPHDPNAQDLSQRFLGPSAEHWFGTDVFGRDVASRIIDAARISLAAPAISLTIAIVIAVPAGLFAALRRGPFDFVSSRVSDAVMSIPSIVFALAIIAALGPGLTTAMLAIGIVFAPYLYRVVRGAAMVVVEEPYVASSKVIGASQRRTLFLHVLPNIAAPVLVEITLLMGYSLLAEASLSFLGLGVQPPEASWGSMLKSAYEYQFESPFGVLAPGIAITCTVLAFNTLGDAIRDALVKGGRR